jgi:hypothetical protein
MIPEAHYAEAAPAEVVCAGAIDLLIVLPAIRLDDQLSLQADEVGDVGANGVLEAELPAEAAAAKSRPQEELGIGREAAKRRSVRTDLTLHGQHEALKYQ